ncbi:nucleotidyltransferase family protein [Aestuariimicrobium ganziense]|uniref:nucleotidyltransferase family protein n=1 Tax=Aestuariimicrobium ganziense TaxID=2773677 RepID=UPI00194573A1|nr:nucleotidyltransferase family protein [Aestuariimicrobium ganziense]
MSSEPRGLTLDEAVPLCTVVTARALEAAGIRALAVKGPTFTALGVRRGRVSMDVDLLVDPTRHQDAEQVLRTRGWQLWAIEYAYRPFGAHSTTWEHPQWACSLDLHVEFPGFLAPASDTFEALWTSRVSVPVAHQPVATPCRPHAVALDLLHALRDARPEHEDEVVAAALAAIPQPLTPDEIRQLATFLPATGSVETLAALVRSLDFQVEGASTPLRSEALDRWRLRQRAGEAPLAWWAYELRHHPWLAVRHLARELWPTEGQARTWAKSKQIPYPGRRQVVQLRAAKAWRWLTRSAAARLPRRS